MYCSIIWLGSQVGVVGGGSQFAVRALQRMLYLPSESILRLLDELTLLAALGSWLGFDVITSAMLTSSLTRQWFEMQASSGAPWIGVLDDPQAFLAERGWQAYLTLVS
jgi:O-methyltransferase involved in polyketide biosynthesis